MHCENSSTAGRLNRAMFAAFALLLGLFYAAPLFAQALNPPYLREMPPVDRVLRDMQTPDPAETAARQMGALLQLKKMIEDAAGPRFYNRAVGLTPDETRIRQAYYTAYYQISQSKPEYKGINGLRGYDISPQFRDELFRRYFSPAFRAQVLNANAAADARTAARLRAEKAQSDAVLAASGGYNPPRYVQAPAPNSATPNAQTPASSAQQEQARAWIINGKNQLDKKDYAQAVFAFQQAIRADPTFADGYSNLGLAYFDQELYQQAASALKQYLSLKPDDAQAIALLSVSYYRLNQYQSAVALLRQAVRLRPNDADIQSLLSQAEKSAAQSGGSAGPPSAQAPAATTQREVAQALIKEGNEQLDKKNDSQAIVVFQEAIRADPSSAEAYRGEGLAYYDLQQYAQAVEALEQAIRLNPNTSDGPYWLGKTYFALNQNDKALRTFREAVRINTKDAGSWSYVGLCYFTALQFPEAVQAFQESIRLEPSDTTLYALGETYVYMGKRAEALDVYKRLIASDKEDAAKLYAEINKPK